MKPKTVIGIPGTWATRAEIVQAIAKDSGGYIFAGQVLMEVATKNSWTLEVYDHEPNLRSAFEIAGQGAFSSSLLDQIDSHTFTLYVLSDQASTEAARELQKVGSALLDCGGLAVKVESAGVAHTPETWRALTESDKLFERSLKLVA